MDNFRIDVTSIGKEDLLQTMKLAFSKHSSGAIGYRVDTDTGILIFYWYVDERYNTVTKFPFKMGYEMATDFAAAWLTEQNYGKEPDHDGHNKKGWRVYNEQWGHVGGSPYAFCAVKPVWAMYGK